MNQSAQKQTFNGLFLLFNYKIRTGKIAMSQKFSFTLLLVLVISAFGLRAAAQTGEEIFPVNSSKLAVIDLPGGARQIKDDSIPGEIKNTLAKLVAAGGDKIRQGDSEVVIWSGDYKKTKGTEMVKNLENTLKTSGWEYEIGERNNDFVLFSLFRPTPARRVLVGFFVPSEEAFVFALTEMVRAGASTVSQTENRVTEETNPAKSTIISKPNGDMSIYGKWYRGTGSGFVDYTGKTQYKAGESFYFEFFPDGTIEYKKEVDVLSIIQCKIKGTDKARGKYSIGGGTLTINLGAMSSVQTNSCDSKENFNKTIEPSTTTVQFQIKKMESITRPDNPTIMCFNGKDDACYERVNK